MSKEAAPLEAAPLPKPASRTVNSESLLKSHNRFEDSDDDWVPTWMRNGKKKPVTGESVAPLSTEDPTPQNDRAHSSVSNEVNLSTLPRADVDDEENLGNVAEKSAEVQDPEDPTKEEGFGASMGITEEDLARSEREDKSDAQVAFERFGNVAKEKAKSVWNKGVELFGRCKNWAATKWETIKTVSKEWAGDVVETIKLQTVDKWRVVNEVAEYNRLSKLKAAEILNITGWMETEEKNMTGYEEAQRVDEEKFQQALAGMTNPGFREVFERNRVERSQDWEGKKQDSQNRIDGFIEQRRQCAQDIADFHFGIKESGERFAGRLDEKIDKIQEKYGYAEKVSCLGETNNLIAENEATISGIDTQLIEHAGYLKTARELGINENDIKDMENGISALVAERDAAESRIAQFNGVKNELEKSIAKIDKKTARYRNIKKEMGLDKVEGEGEVVSEAAVETGVEETGEEMPAEIEVVSSDGAVAEEGTRAESEYVPNVSEDTEDGESNESVESREAIKETQEISKQLFATITKKDVKAVEIVRSLMMMRNVFDKYKNVLDQDEVSGMLENLSSVLKVTHQMRIERATNEETFQLKRTVTNGIIRRLPSWIEL